LVELSLERVLDLAELGNKDQEAHLMDDTPESDMSLGVSYQFQASRQWVAVRQSNVWRPATDVYELEDRLVVLVEIPGMRDGEFSVIIQDRRLFISGVRRRANQERAAFHQMEVRYGEFRTGVALPWIVDRERVSAVYRDGFLRVELPRAVNQQIHIVNVDVEQDAPADPSTTAS
jgi:HSP20 family protein